MYHHSLLKTKFLALMILVFACTGSNTILFAQGLTKWIRVCALHGWFSEVGCEWEVGRRGLIPDQIDGLQWPAQYRWQDTQAAKGLWIGSQNYYDIVAGQTYPHKVVQVGPRAHAYANEIYPIEFKMIGRFDHSTVLVDGNIASNLDFDDVLDEIDPNLKADRLLITKMRTSMGIEMTRKIYAFTQQYHNNYFIYDFVFKNTGIVDTSGSQNPQTLTGAYFSWQCRYAICKEMSAYGLFIMPQNATWGINTMNDVIGEDPSAGDPFRALFAWHGLHSGAPFNNIGAPDIDRDGRLTSSQIVGVVTLHADKSPTDNSDDPFQPSATKYIDSDATINQGGFHNQYTPEKMTQQYNFMSSGHPPLSHAEEVGDGYANEYLNTAAGFSQSYGFGPYSLATGDSIRIVLAEGVAGLSRSNNIEVGYNWFNEIQPYILPDGSTTTDKNEYKNAWVFTGKDSLFQTFTRATDNYTSGFNIPQPPPPPDLFEVTSGSDHIQLTWSNSAEAWPNFAGYHIYRATVEPDTTYELIATLPPGILQYDDTAVSLGFNYYYYLVSFDDGSTNNIQPGVPLASSKFYTMTNLPAYLGATGIGKTQENKIPNAFRLDQNYPNPFNPSTTIRYALPKSAKVVLKIYNALGQEIITLVDKTQTVGEKSVVWDGRNQSGQLLSSGVYIYKLQADGFFESRKMLFLK